MQIKVKLFGVINNEKFTTEGRGNIDPTTGEAYIHLRYSSVPPNWNPLNYSDPLVLLAGYREEEGGLNLMSLSKGSYKVESTIDFGDGHYLRKTASVRLQGDTLMAAYSLFGTARVSDIVSVEPYEEHMIPAGDGQMIAVGLAKWKTVDNNTIQALVSSRITFEEPKEILKSPQIRRFEVDPSLSEDGLEYKAKYKTRVTSV